jgi:hypothetical protein
MLKVIRVLLVVTCACLPVARGGMFYDLSKHEMLLIILENSICTSHKTHYKSSIHTQENGAVSKVNKTFISHLARAQRILSATASVQVSRALLAVRF